MRRTAWASAAILLALVNGCTSSASPDVAVEGEITVVASLRTAPGRPAVYNTAVVFRVHNISEERSAGVNYSVTIHGGGTDLFAGDSADTVIVGPSAIRLVVFTTAAVIGRAPESGEVRLKPPPPRLRDIPDVDTSLWSFTDLEVECAPGVAECDVVGTITWHGEDAQAGLRVMVALPDTSGRIVAAGAGPAEAARLSPGGSSRFRFLLVGLGPEDRAKAGTREAEVYVESAPAR